MGHELSILLGVAAIGLVILLIGLLKGPRGKAIRNTLGLKKHTDAPEQLHGDFDVIDHMDGATFDRWCGSLLESVGFQVIQYTPASGDQGVDIVAERSGIRYAIQCKRLQEAVGHQSVQQAAAGKETYRCDQSAVMTNNWFTDSAKKTAEERNVLLWDRAKLCYWLKKAGFESNLYDLVQDEPEGIRGERQGNSAAQAKNAEDDEGWENLFDS